MLCRSTDPISALTGCHAPARGAGRTAHAPGSPTPPLGPLGPQERAGDRRGARRAPPAEPPEALCRLRWRGSRAPARARARPRRARGLRMRRHPSPSSRWQSACACRRVGGVVEAAHRAQRKSQRSERNRLNRGAVATRPTVKGKAERERFLEANKKCVTHSDLGSAACRLPAGAGVGTVAEMVVEGVEYVIRLASRAGAA